MDDEKWPADWSPKLIEVAHRYRGEQFSIQNFINLIRAVLVAERLDEDKSFLTELLATLAQEISRLREENQEYKRELEALRGRLEHK